MLFKDLDKRLLVIDLFKILLIKNYIVVSFFEDFFCNF